MSTVWQAWVYLVDEMKLVLEFWYLIKTWMCCLFAMVNMLHVFLYLCDAVLCLLYRKILCLKAKGKALMN